MIASIVWDVSSDIVKLPIFGFEWPLTWYSLLFASSFVCGQLLLNYLFRRDGKPASDADTLLTYGIVATVLGARLGHYLFYEWEFLVNHPGKWFVSLITPPFRGLASHGAMIALLIALYIYSRKRADQSYRWVLDRAVIAISLGGAMIRLGNLMNSEIYGKPTQLPWGFVFLRETDPELLPLVPRHPTQLYESLFCLFLFGLTFYLWKQKRKQLPEGTIASVFLILLFSFRFSIEFLKNNQSDFESSLALNMGQLLSIPVILIGWFMLVTVQKGSNLIR